MEGFYIIEDIETSYWDAPDAARHDYSIQEAGIGKRGNVVEKLKGVSGYSESWDISESGCSCPS